METFQKNLKTINNIGWFYIIAGCIEILFFLFLSNSLFALIPGLITIFSAYFMQSNNDKRWGYFVGSWALFKYSPFGFALVAFVLGDFFRKGGYDIRNYNNETYNML